MMMITMTIVTKWLYIGICTLNESKS